MHIAKKIFQSVLAACFLAVFPVFARQFEVEKSKRKPPDQFLKSAGSPRYTVLNIGNLTTWHRSDGQSNHSPQADNGLYFPRGTGPVVYQDGLVWGAKAFLDSGLTIPVGYHHIRVGGGTYGVGTRAGWVNGFGATATPADPNSAAVRIFRIRRDYVFMSEEELRQDAAEVNEISPSQVTLSQINAVRAQYERDWVEWPAQHGAPHIERNAIKGYQAPPPFSSEFTPDSLIRGHFDEPGIAGDAPDEPADQVIWTAFNDLSEPTTLLFASSEPLGLEIQKTVWGYDRLDARGNMYFSRYKLINRGGVDTSVATGFQGGSFYLDSLFFCFYVDPDLGSFIDDLGGSDTLLGIGYCFNADDDDPPFKTFGLPPPAFGYVVLQGPTLPSPIDTAIVDMKRVVGYKNQPMTSVGVWGAGDPYSHPPTGGPGGYNYTTGGWWKALRGFAPIGSFSDPDGPYYAPPGANPKFMYSGDPIARTGWIDGSGTILSLPPGDRQILVNTGPCRLAPGESQEVVFAHVGGVGADRLSSVAVMKANVALARKMHSNFFASPSAPRRPVVQAAELDAQIILTWGTSPEVVQATESAVIGGEYVFEGYNVYQLPAQSASLHERFRITTFDVKNNVKTILEPSFDPVTKRMTPMIVQQGSNSGIQRYLRITRDFLGGQTREKTLENGGTYYFAVTAYNYSAVPGTAPISLESTPVVLKVKPRVPFGITSLTSPMDTLATVHSRGVSQGSVLPIVLDPTSGTGDTYEVRFDTLAGPVRWSVVNISQNTPVLTGQSNQNGDEDYLIVEGGILLKVIDDPTQKNSPSDTFLYTVPAVRRDQSALKASVQRIGVFPNPYYAGRDQETTTWRKFVTFNNLPQKATIRIFNLAGHLVRTLQKDDPSQFFEWDLTNEYNWQVASGMYICYIEMPEIGETKILKLALIQPLIIR